MATFIKLSSPKYYLFVDGEVQGLIESLEVVANLYEQIKTIIGYEDKKITVVGPITMSLKPDQSQGEVHVESKHIVLEYYSGGTISIAEGAITTAQIAPGTISKQTPLWAAVPALAEFANCPACSLPRKKQLWGLIQHINDEHKWSREAIADWLETLDMDINFKMEEK